MSDQIVSKSLRGAAQLVALKRTLMACGLSLVAPWLALGYAADVAGPDGQRGPAVAAEAVVRQGGGTLRMEAPQDVANAPEPLVLQLSVPRLERKHEGGARNVVVWRRDRDLLSGECLGVCPLDVAGPDGKSIRVTRSGEVSGITSGLRPESTAVEAFVLMDAFTPAIFGVRFKLALHLAGYRSVYLSRVRQDAEVGVRENVWLRRLRRATGAAEAAAPSSGSEEVITVRLVNYQLPWAQQQIEAGKLDPNLPPILLEGKQFADLDALRAALRQRSDPERFPDRSFGELVEGSGLYPSQKMIVVRVDRGQIFGWVQAIEQYGFLVTDRDLSRELRESPLLHKIQVEMVDSGPAR